MIVVVDTNVAVVANGRSQQACAECVLTCTEKLQQIMSGEMKLVLDDDWRILDEYMRNLRSRGADVGDRFLQWLLTHKDRQCDFVSITPVGEFRKMTSASFPRIRHYQVLIRRIANLSLSHSHTQKSLPSCKR